MTLIAHNVRRLKLLDRTVEIDLVFPEFCACRPYHRIDDRIAGQRRGLCLLPDVGKVNEPLVLEPNTNALFKRKEACVAAEAPTP